MYVSGSSTVAYVECYDADYNEWYDASPMNLSRSALSACVIAGLANAREYSYLGKARDLGQGRCNIRHGGFCRESQRRWLNLRLCTAHPGDTFIHIYDTRNRDGDAQIHDSFSVNFHDAHRRIWSDRKARTRPSFVIVNYRQSCVAAVKVLWPSWHSRFDKLLRNA